MARTGRVDRERVVGVSRSGPDFVDSIHGFPACATTIGTHQLALVTECQVFQLLGQMHTQEGSLLRCVDVCCLGFHHIPSMWGTRSVHTLSSRRASVQRRPPGGAVVRPTPRPRLVAVPVPGAEGGSAPRKRSEPTPTPLPRAVLFYTLFERFPALTQEVTAIQ
jgi:hypothetical protein